MQVSPHCERPGSELAFIHKSDFGRPSTSKSFVRILLRDDGVAGLKQRGAMFFV